MLRYYITVIIFIHLHQEVRVVGYQIFAKYAIIAIKAFHTIMNKTLNSFISYFCIFIDILYKFVIYTCQLMINENSY